jgi:Ca-activated chloride channel homolog
MHLTAQLDLNVLAHETDDQLSTLVELTAPKAPANASRGPSTLVVVLDRSGSMTGARIGSAKTALLALVDRLHPADRFGLVTFDTEVQVVVPTGPLTDKLAVKQAIVTAQPGGGTDLSAGYFRGLQEVRRAAGRQGATVLLISDGHANAGLCDPAQLGEVARKARAGGVTTTTLGMGLGFDERLLSAIAVGGAGTEGFAETADDALNLIAAEVDGLLSLAAQAGSAAGADVTARARRPHPERAAVDRPGARGDPGRARLVLLQRVAQTGYHLRRTRHPSTRAGADRRAGLHLDRAAQPRAAHGDRSTARQCGSR